MDRNSFLDALTEKHNEFKAEESGIDNLSNALAFYESFIPDFFSKTGEAEAIMNMYNDIRTMYEAGEEKQIDCVDISKSASMYLEYMEGMITFINDISNVNVMEGSTDDLMLFTDKFNKAKEKDSMFIESLYDGKLSEVVEMPLSEAVQNVEFLIDFIPNLQIMNKNCCLVKESLSTIEDSKKQLLNDCVVMLCESVNNFCYSTIHSVLNTYNTIQNALKNESTDEAGNTGFRLF